MSQPAVNNKKREEKEIADRVTQAFLNILNWMAAIHSMSGFRFFRVCLAACLDA